MGIVNVIRVSVYKTLVKCGLHPVQKIKSDLITGEFFKINDTIVRTNFHSAFKVEELKNGYFAFSDHYFHFDKSPNWHLNYYNNRKSKFQNISWWKIPDFDPEVGDIKAIWELSRFSWVVQLAVCYLNGEDSALELLNSRLSDWCKKNPPYKGVNWKCGQEASIRVMHLIYAAIILKQENKPSSQLLHLINVHLKRIAPTISYAIGQNNNHGTSEAAALFTGGNFLFRHGYITNNSYEKLGRKWLENRAFHLFSDDGAFSQFSVIYHRLALDTYSFCETYRRLFSLQDFSKKMREKLVKAVEWLEILTDFKSGDCPNIGANDGAHLFPVFKNNYREFRPSVQWGSIVFKGHKTYSISSEYDNLFDYLKLDIKSLGDTYSKTEKVILGNKSGIFIFRSNAFLLLIRRPVFRYRPAQSDVLHMDLWINGINLLRDAGTFSYNSSDPQKEIYSSPLYHNTISFDSRFQMPKISRFLYGSWAKENIFQFTSDDKSCKIVSGYSDYLGSSHLREVLISSNLVVVNDTVNGFSEKAILSWRLAPLAWEMKNKNLISNKIAEIELRNNKIDYESQLIEENESRYYYSEKSIPVLKISIFNPGTFTTNINFNEFNIF